MKYLQNSPCCLKPEIHPGSFVTSKNKQFKRKQGYDLFGKLNPIGPDALSSSSAMMSWWMRIAFPLFMVVETND